ncbi:MAG: helix-turn-helix domain-containing protein [Clostridia bacterium]
MKYSNTLTSKDLTLSIDNYQQIQPITHALSTNLRLQMLRLIADTGMSVNEIAHALDIPVSTSALNVHVLEKAGLITSDLQPGSRGKLKICDRSIDHLSICLIAHDEREGFLHQYDMPVGCYRTVGSVQPTCGFASWEAGNGMYDMPAAFYHPKHFMADIIWMRDGYVEYDFPALDFDRLDNLDYLEFSFEACAEAPNYRNDWPSHLCVSVNGVEIGQWLCDGDYGGRRGTLNPSWWGDHNTQYGRLTSWRVNQHGTLLENQPISSVSLRDLQLGQADHLTLRIAVGRVNGVPGGMNLFGKRFGDFPQDIIMRCAGHA